MKNRNIDISILNVKDLKKFLETLIKSSNQIKEIPKIDKVFDIDIHLDVMDNKFVPNIGVDLEKIKMIKEFGFKVDVHLMVEKPIEDGYVDKAILYGADNITIHYEIKNFDDNLLKLHKRIDKKNITIGVSVKPNTDVTVLKKYEKLFSKILVMTVEPGFGGQEYVDFVNQKIELVRKGFKNKIIQIDGGVNFQTISKPLRIGVDHIVIGNYITKDYEENLYNKLLKLNILKYIESIEKNSNINFDTKLLQMIPNGYGYGSELIGVKVPNIRKSAKLWYKYIEVKNLDDFISSKYHDYKRFAIFCMSNYFKDKNINRNFEYVNIINSFFESNLKYINNWDLTDESGPNILAPYLYILDKSSMEKKLLWYINNEELWVRRIGIVSLLTFIRKDYDTNYIFKICDIVCYDKRDLIQKATGWVLRELYKKHPIEVKEYLINKNRNLKLPNILLNYACEKMDKEEKGKIKSM